MSVGGGLLSPCGLSMIGPGISLDEAETPRTVRAVQLGERTFSQLATVPIDVVKERIANRLRIFQLPLKAREEEADQALRGFIASLQVIHTAVELRTAYVSSCDLTKDYYDHKVAELVKATFSVPICTSEPMTAISFQLPAPDDKASTKTAKFKFSPCDFFTSVLEEVGYRETEGSSGERQQLQGGTFYRSEKDSVMVVSPATTTTALSRAEAAKVVGTDKDDRRRKRDEGWDLINTYGINQVEQQLIAARKATQVTGATSGGTRSTTVLFSNVGHSTFLNLTNIIAGQQGLYLAKLYYDEPCGEGLRLMCRKLKEMVDRWITTEIIPLIGNASDSSLAKTFLASWQEHLSFTAFLSGTNGNKDAKEAAKKGIVDDMLFELGSKSEWPDCRGNNPSDNQNLELGKGNHVTLTWLCLEAYYKQVVSTRDGAKAIARLQDLLLSLVLKLRNGLGDGSELETLKDGVKFFHQLGGIERSGSSTAHIKFPKTVDDFSLSRQSLAVYKREFELPFLEATRAFYREKSRVWLQSGVPYFIDMAKRAVVTEEAFVGSAGGFLFESSRDFVIKTALEEIVVANKDKLAEEITAILKSVYDYSATIGDDRDCAVISEGKKQTLKNLFELFYQTQKCAPHDPAFDCITHMANTFQEYASNIGKNIIEARHLEVTQAIQLFKEEKGKKPSERDPNFIKSLLSMFAAMEEMTSGLFGQHVKFIAAKENAFKKTCGSSLTVIPSLDEEDKRLAQFGIECMLAAYMDKFLDPNDKSNDRTEEAMNKTLDLFVKVLVCCNEVDLFEEYYRTHFARRLLKKNSEGARCFNMDLEKQVIEKIKFQLVNPDFTAKLGMVHFHARDDSMLFSSLIFTLPHLPLLNLSFHCTITPPKTHISPPLYHPSSILNRDNEGRR